MEFFFGVVCGMAFLLLIVAGCACAEDEQKKAEDEGVWQRRQIADAYVARMEAERLRDTPRMN